VGHHPEVEDDAGAADYWSHAEGTPQGGPFESDPAGVADAALGIQVKHFGAKETSDEGARHRIGQGLVDHAPEEEETLPLLSRDVHAQSVSSVRDLAELDQPGRGIDVVDQLGQEVP
jgi:hypothetical protein